VIKCDRWGSEGYRVIGGLVFLRLVRFQASNREYISGHSARLVYLLVLTVLSMHFMGCLIAYDMYRGRLQGWKGSDLDWSNYMDNNDDIWNVGGTGEYPPLHPLFTNIGDAYFDCIWRVAGVLTGNISWISPAGVPQSSLSRFIGVLCFFYTLLLNAVLIAEVGNVMHAVLNSDADADERDEIFAVRRCLHYHRVDAKVSERVLKYYKFAWRSRKGCLPLEDVAAKLPKALRLELDLAALFEKCRAIPFVSAHEGATVIQFLRALSMQTVPAGQVVFRRGEPARALCYVLLGRLSVVIPIERMGQGHQKNYLDANLQQLQLLIPGMSAGGAGLFSQECTSKVTICNRSKDWAEIASITKADVMTLCENDEVRHWFEEAAHQENFLIKAAAKRSPSEESVSEESVVTPTPTWRQQLRHFETHKKSKKMDHVRDAIAAFSTFDMHDMVGAPEPMRTSSTMSPQLRGLSPQRSVSSGASSPAARRRAVSK